MSRRKDETCGLRRPARASVLALALIAALLGAPERALAQDSGVPMPPEAAEAAPQVEVAEPAPAPSTPAMPAPAEDARPAPGQPFWAKPAAKPAPQPVGTPAPAPTGGPTIDLPPEAEQASAARPGASAAGREGDVPNVELRTSPFSTLPEKAAAIVNRTVIGGYGEFFFTKRRGEDSYFDARRFVVFLYSPISERISLSTEIEFEHGGSPLKRDGALGPGEVQLEFAAIDVKLHDALILRAGVILVPFGRYNINHDAPTQELSDRPLAVTYIVPTTWFEIGAGAVGRLELPAGFSWSYEIYAINGLDSNIRDGLGYRAARGSKAEDNNDDKAIVGRTGLSYFGRVGGRSVSFDAGVSGYTGAYNRAGRRANLLGADLALRIVPFEIVGEIARAWNDYGFDDDYPNSSRLLVPQDLWGGYIELRYRLMPAWLRRRMPEWLSGAGFVLVARYDQIDTDMSVRSIGDRTRLSFGIGFRPIQAVIWKHELQLDQVGERSTPRHLFDDPGRGYVTSVAFLF